MPRIRRLRPNLTASVCCHTTMATMRGSVVPAVAGENGWDAEGHDAETHVAAGIDRRRPRQGIGYPGSSRITNGGHVENKGGLPLARTR